MSLEVQNKWERLCLCGQRLDLEIPLLETIFHLFDSSEKRGGCVCVCERSGGKRGNGKE